MGDIYKKIAAVMNDCGAVSKSAYNNQQKYKYRGIDAVMNALNPAMSKHGIFTAPEVLDIRREERTSRQGGTLIYSVVTVKYTFYCEDGSSVSATVMGEGMDAGDKSINKAMSAAFKYACFQIFCIPTEEMHDSEEDSPEVTAKPKLGEAYVNSLKKCIGLHGQTVANVCKASKVTKLEDLTIEQYKYWMDKMGEKV